MFNPSNETHFSLTVEDYAGDLQVLSFSGTEGISQPYRFDLELVSENPDLDLEKLLHKQAFLAFDPKGSGIHGQIYRVCLLYTSPSPRDGLLSRMPSSA